jgi:hypothetical protein
MPTRANKNEQPAERRFIGLVNEASRAIRADVRTRAGPIAPRAHRRVSSAAIAVGGTEARVGATISSLAIAVRRALRGADALQPGAATFALEISSAGLLRTARPALHRTTAVGRIARGGSTHRTFSRVAAGRVECGPAASAGRAGTSCAGDARAPTPTGNTVATAIGSARAAPTELARTVATADRASPCTGRQTSRIDALSGCARAKDKTGAHHHQQTANGRSRHDASRRRALIEDSRCSQSGPTTFAEGSRPSLLELSAADDAAASTRCRMARARNQALVDSPAP